MTLPSWARLRRPPRSLSGRCAALLWATALGAACGGDDGTGSRDRDGGLRAGVHARFELAADPMPFGAIPWPDDLYLDEDGHIAVGPLPGEGSGTAPGYHDDLRRGLSELDGFGAASPVFFGLDGALDPRSLPQTASDSVAANASVFLMDVDPASPGAFTRHPVRVRWQEPLRSLALRPEDGRPLAEGRRYAAVVTRAVRDAGGAPLGAAPGFAAIRDADARPADPLLARAYEQYTPVLASLESHGVRRRDVVAMAVFRVQRIGADLRDARARLWEGAAPPVTIDEVVRAGAALDGRLGTPAEDVPGLDVPGGVRHGAIGWMVHGGIDAPWLLDATPGVPGRFRRDFEGRLLVTRTERVPFTLWLPRSGDLSALPVVVVQHGLGGDRSEALAFADALNGAGYAVVAIDAPFHGLRSARADVDRDNRFTGQEAPDGFGDLLGSEVLSDFAGILDGRGELSAFHPFYLRDSLRQGVVDLMALVRALRDAAAWSSLRAADPALGALGFDAGPLGFVGLSLGGVMGTMLTAAEPEVGASLLAVTGGHLTQLVQTSPDLHAGFIPHLWPILGLDPDAIDHDGDPPIFHPEVAVWQTLLDRGDPIHYGTRIRARQVDVMMLMARHDEVLHNLSTEALARTLAAPLVGGEPAYVDLAAAAAPVRDNATVDGDMRTRALYVHEPATHGLLTHRTGIRRYAHPVEPPFEPVEPTEVTNPLDAAIAQMLHFFESWRTGAAEVAAP